MTESRLLSTRGNMTARPTAAALLEQGTGYLTRSHLRELGLERRAVDAVFRALPVVVFEGYSRTLLRVEDFIAYQERCVHSGNRVRA